MFQKATRKKIRFESSQGNLTVEDLWDIPLTATSSKVGQINLDDIAKRLFNQLKESETTSFVIKNKSVDDTILLKFEIVKHIIDVRLAEVEAAEAAKANKEKKQQILAIIAAKENEQLMKAPIEELKKMLD